MTKLKDKFNNPPRLITSEYQLHQIGRILDQRMIDNRAQRENKPQ